MESSRYFVKGRTFSAGDPLLQQALASVHGSSERPRCMCVPGGVEMYIARHAEYVIKRMPDSGAQHDPQCPSFEPEPTQSGLAPLLGSAITELAPDECVIRTDFAMRRLGSRGAPVPGPAAADGREAVAHAASQGMSLRATLHFLYERAGFNRWSAAMQGKRNQGVLRTYLMEAAQGVILKGERLSERLFVPEAFRVQAKEEIEERRRTRLARMLTGAEGEAPMGLLIGEFVRADKSHVGRRLVVKHMPGAPLLIDDKTWGRALRLHATLLQAQQADLAPHPRVLLAALIYARGEGQFQVQALTLMLVTDQYLPLDGLHEMALLHALQGRKFVKPLRYDAPSKSVFPNVLLLDCEHAPRALYMSGPFQEHRQREAIHARAAEDGAWCWNAGAPMPELPPVRTATAWQRGERTVRPEQSDAQESAPM